MPRTNAPFRKFNPRRTPAVMPHTKKDLQQDKQIVNLKKKVKKLNADEEVSFKDTFITSAATSAAVLTLLNGMTQGDADSARDKSLANFTSIQLKGFAINDPDSLVSTVYRLMIVWDKAANGAAPTIAQLLDNSTITDYLVAPYNKDYFKRFKFVYDKKFVINPLVVGTTTVATGVVAQFQPAVKWFEKRIKSSRQTNYGLGNAGTVADISINSCYFVAISNIAAGATAPALDVGIRMYYKDA